jgi:hypothetical protein
VCDLSYAVQREEVAARALAEMQLAPHVEDPHAILTPDAAVAELDRWLNERPADLDKPAGEMDLMDLLQLGGRR